MEKKKKKKRKRIRKRNHEKFALPISSYLMRTTSRNKDSISKFLDECPWFNSYMIADRNREKRSRKPNPRYLD